MLPKLIILSDLWGVERADWLRLYTLDLSSKYEVQYFDSCDLGAVDKTDYIQENLHTQFVSGGIDQAVQSLLDLDLGKVTILAFSVGGVIAWKYGLKGGSIVSLYCVSSTRLRYESSKPSGSLNLYFGNQDEYRPNGKWFDKMGLENNVIESKDHHLYRDVDFVESLLKKMIE